MNSDFPSLPGNGMFNLIFAIAILMVLATFGFYGWVAYQGVQAAKNCGGVPQAVVHKDANGDTTYSVKCPDIKAPKTP